MCKNNFDYIENKDDKLVVSHHNVASLLDVDANFCLSELRDHHSLTIREPLVEICYDMQSFIQTIPDARGPLLSSFLLDNQTHLRPKSGLSSVLLMLFLPKKMPDLIHKKVCWC